MKKIIFIMAILLANNIFAADISKQIAVVDIQRVIKDSLAAKSIGEQIEKKRSEYQNDFNKKETDLNKKHQQLSKQQTVLSKEAFEKKVQEFDGQVSEVQKDVQEKRGKLDESYMEAIATIQEQVEAIIEELSKENGFSIAIPTSQILFAKSELDISDEVLKRLNKKLTKVSVKIE